MSWESNPPSAFDVVTGYFPEHNPRTEGAVNRPLLVLRVSRHVETGEFACKVAYGTKNVKLLTRGSEDLIIANVSAMNTLGLKYPTRFVLAPPQNLMWLPWKEPHFVPWQGYTSPILGSLTEEMAKDVVWKLAGR